MNQLYARVFLQILDSSIAEDFTARHIFEDFLKLSDDGIVDMTREAIARRLNVPIKILNGCIEKLESPDLNSRDRAFEGRRIERLDDHRDWGWKILNWQKYEVVKNRAQVAERVAKHRRLSAEPVAIPATLNTPDFLQAWADWSQHRMEIKKPLTSLASQRQLDELAAWGSARAILAINHSIKKQWQGIFEPKESNETHRSDRDTNPRNSGVARCGPTDEERAAAKLQRQDARR